MVSFLRHFLFPTNKNNFRAKLLHNSSLAIIIFVFLMFSGGIFYFRNTHPGVLGISYSITESELLTNTNSARSQNNKSALNLNPQLSDAARRKAAHMFENNYWAHFAPDGTTPWSFIKAAGYSYAYAGENLAKGFTTSQDVVNAWMNSPSHKENILSDKYQDIGFAVVEGKLQGEETVLVVEMFGSQTAVQAQNTIPSQPATVSQPIAQEESVKQEVASSKEVIPLKPVIDTQKASKPLVTVFLIFIITVLILDILAVEKRKIPRLVGHNLDHIILLVIFLLFIFLTTNKGIL